MMDLPKPACIHGSRSKTCERCDLERQLAAVTAELAAAREDAERFRWLRRNGAGEIGGRRVAGWSGELERAIDAARSAEQRSEGGEIKP